MENKTRPVSHHITEPWRGLKRNIPRVLAHSWCRKVTACTILLTVPVSRELSVTRVMPSRPGISAADEAT